MGTQDDPAQPLIAREAALWWRRLREVGHSAEVEQQFFAWLQASPKHADAYLAFASQPLETTDTPDDPAVEPQSDLQAAAQPPAPRAGYRNTRVLGIALLMSVFGFGAWWWVRPASNASLRPELSLATSHGHVRQWRLDDGSIIELASDSVARVRYSSAERLVQLEAGHGYFQVAKGDRRRFRVLADGASVVATGTEFDINMTRHRNVVSLLEGHVVVYADTVALSGQAESDATTARELRPGDQVTITDGWVSRPTRVDLGHIQAWRKGQIVAEGLALADVVDEFNLYAAAPIRIADPSLARTPISGVFSVHDRETFVAFLRASIGAELHPAEHGWLLVSGHRPAEPVRVDADP